MNFQRINWPGYWTVGTIFLLAGLVNLGFIPGVGILLLAGAFLVWAVGLMMGRAAIRISPGGLWAGLGLALLGVLLIFKVDPVFGAGVLLAGLGLTAGSAAHQWFQRARDR